MQLPPWSYGDGKTPTPSWFKKNRGHLQFTYRQGGATMGETYNFFLKAPFIFSKGIKISDEIRMDNLSKLYINDMEITLPNQYQYGAYHFSNETQVFGGQSDDISLMNQELYLPAVKSNDEVAYSILIAVNIQTGKLREVMKIPSYPFRLSGDELAYLSNGILHRVNLITQKDTTWILDSIKEKIYNLEIVGNVIYLQGANHLYQVKADGVHVINSKGKVTEIFCMDQYIIALFEETPENPYRIICLNDQGDVIYKTSDTLGFVRPEIANQKLYYFTKESPTLYAVDLK